MEVCRLCLDLLQGDEFTKLDSSYKSVIINVIPEVDLEISPDPVICKQCSKSIDEIGKFKQKCHESEAQLKQKSHGQVSQNLTVKQILHGSNSEQVIISEKAKERVCRTCLESIEFESFTILTPSSSDAYLESMLTMCLSDVDLQISRDPVMCEKCFSCLQQYHQVKTAYLEVEEKIRKYSSVNHINSALQINLHNVLEMLQTDQKDKHNLTTAVNIKSEYGNKTDVINESTDGEFETDLNQLLNEDNSRILAEEINIKMEEEFYSTLFATIQVVLFSQVNSEVDICFKLGTRHAVQDPAEFAEIHTLLQEASKEIETAVRESEFGSALSRNYSYFRVHLSHPAITLDGNTTNGSLIIDEQILRTLTFVADGFEIFNLTFPSIYINGSYNVIGYVGAHRLFDIYGKGEFYLQMLNFSVAAITSLKINSTSLCIPITVKLYVKDYKNDFQNFMDGDVDLDPLLNGAMQSLVPDAIRIFFREGADAADPYIQSIIDKIFNPDNGSLTQLLHILADNVKAVHHT